MFLASCISYLVNLSALLPSSSIEFLFHIKLNVVLTIADALIDMLTKCSSFGDRDLPPFDSIRCLNLNSNSRKEYSMASTPLPRI